ncbi:MAG: c-type cytochrome [Bacteroidota bacterium]
MYSRILKITGKKNGILILLICLSFIAISATGLREDKPVNLKVLPKDISEKDLNKIMVEDCGDGLGVTCDYCHVEDKTLKKFDYASDAKSTKDTARSMMRMTLELNKKYFGQNQPVIGDSTMPVTCYTCHHGFPAPNEKK